MIFAPLYLCSVVFFYGTFNLDLRSVEDRGSSADLQADFLHTRVVLDVFRFAYGNRRSVIFRRTLLRVTHLSVGWLYSRAHRIDSSNLMILCHRLFTQDSAILVSGTARLWAASPLAHLPSCRAIKNVTILPIRWWRMGTHAVGHNHCIFTAPRDFMNAINFSGFDADTTWFSTRRVIWIVPSGRAGNIVASSDSVLGLCFWRA